MTTVDRQPPRTAMRDLMCAMLASGAVVTSCSSSEAGGRALLSIVALPISPGQYVSSFQINTIGIEILAVCRVPDGWSITAASQGGPNGMLEGQGVLGVAFVGDRNPDAFRSVFLIDVGPKPKGTFATSPMFDGSVTVGRYGVDGKDSSLALRPGSYRLTPATRCPAP